VSFVLNLKDKVEDVVERVNIDEIRGALERVIEGAQEKVAKRRPKTIADGFLEEISFNEKLYNHPLVGKAIKKGFTANLVQNLRKSEYYKKLNEKLNDVLKRGVNAEDLRNIEDLVNGLRGIAIEYIVKEISEAEQGLRHLHRPGCIAKSEARNLYFPGEYYTKETLSWLAYGFFSSIAIGDNLGIYSENDKLMFNLKQLAQIFGLKSKSKFKIESSMLGISKDEEDRPYATLLAFILWLAKKLSAERGEEVEIKALARSILDNLRVSTISLLFMPPQKEKWGTISLPRLDMFIDRWILNEESRAKIEALRDALQRFVVVARKTAERERRVKELENAIDLLMDSYEVLCKNLIEHGSLDFHAMRRLVDVIIDIATKYDIRAFLEPLGTVVGRPT
jgi:hypothetical protein